MTDHGQKKAALTGVDLCVKCGNCNPVCPTYNEFANEGMGGRGRLELAAKFIEDETFPSERLERLLFTCLMCGACDKSCPRGISVTEVICEARKKLALSWSKNRPLSSVIKYACGHPSTAYSVLSFLDQTGLLSPLSRFRPFRDFRELGIDIPEEKFRRGLSVYRPPEPRGRVAVFTGCAVDFIYPFIGSALIRILNLMDFEVVLSKKDLCCGAPLLNMGFAKEAERLAEKNLNLFGKLQVDAVISPCPTCVHFIRDVYRDLIGEGVNNATDLMKFMLNAGIADRVNPYLESRHKIMFHDPCHSANYFNSMAEPREILKALGANLIEPSEQSCCGMNGAVSINHKDVAEALGRKKSETFESADIVVTSCPNCVTQLKRFIKEKPVKHVIELLLGGLAEKKS